MTQDLIEALGLGENPTVADLTKLIGDELMLKLSEDLGGKQLYIPLKAGEHSPITVSIGMHAAQRISAAYGGLRFEIPNTAARDAEIMRLYHAGVAQQMIAHKVRLHRKTVSRIIDRRLNSAQADLFASLK